MVCTNRINVLNVKENSGRLVIVAKGFLKLPDLHIQIKQKSLSLRRNLARDFCQFANSVLNKGKFVISPLFNGPEVLSSESDQVKLLAKSFSKKCKSSQVSLYLFFLLELI